MSEITVAFSNEPVATGLFKEDVMTYQLGVVAVIKTNGKVLREVDGTVFLPFGSEYSILLKNLKTVRIMASVSIDGEDTSQGRRFIIGPNASLELERYIRNGNLQAGNRFKFIKRTEGIEAHRGVKVDDGLVRVEYWTEQVPVPAPEPVHHYHHYPDPPWYYPPYPWVRPYDPPYTPYKPWLTWTASSNSNSPSENISYTLGNIQNSLQGEQVGSQCMAMNTANVSTSGGRSQRPSGPSACATSSLSESASAPGITVPGSESKQTFHDIWGFPLEAQSECLVLHLRGQSGGKHVAKPLTVGDKAKCSTCGKAVKANSPFCPKCGTAVTII